MMLNSDQHVGREEINPSTLAPAQNVMAQENNSTYFKSEKTWDLSKIKNNLQHHSLQVCYFYSILEHAFLVVILILFLTRMEHQDPSFRFRLRRVSSKRHCLQNIFFLSALPVVCTLLTFYLLILAS